MAQSKNKLTLHNFQQTHHQNQQQKVLEEALVYLKLREIGCPNRRALSFVKKKEKGIDGTIQKDGPAGFRKLKPDKPQMGLQNGWLVGDKHRYIGLRGFSEEVIRNVSKEKKMITTYNEKDRESMEIMRRKNKKERQGFLKIGENKQMLDQLSTLKDEFLKDREKRNLFLSYSGLRLEQYTRQYFDKIEEVDPDSYIVKLAAFSEPLNDDKVKIEKDWEVAKGRSLSSYEVEGEKKRETVLNFRKTLSTLDPNPPKKGEKFQKILNSSNKKFMTSSMSKLQKQKRMKDEKQFQQFNTDLNKIVMMKKMALT